MLLFTTLAAWGAVSGVFALYAAYRFAKAMISLCDPLTATAVRPTGAYAGLAVWVTGASSGLGLDLSRLLAADGAKLVLSARRKDVLEEVKAELVAAGASPAHIVVLPLDLASLDSLPAAATQAVAAFGGLDVLINNGGISQREVGSKTSFAVDVELTAVDYLSCVALAKAVLPSLASSSAAAGGRIINISSVAGKIGAPLRTAYAGAKAALLAFFDALRVEEHALRTGGESGPYSTEPDRARLNPTDRRCLQRRSPHYQRVPRLDKDQHRRQRRDRERFEARAVGREHRERAAERVGVRPDLGGRALRRRRGVDRAEA